MKFKTTFALTAALVFTVVASHLNAATVTFTLDLSGAPGTFSLYADDSLGDNKGIASYQVDLRDILTIDHNSPRTSFANDTATGNIEGASGFTSFRTADNAVSAALGASQDTISPTPFIIFGYGQEASSFADNGVLPLGGKESVVWDAPLLLATGTYDPQVEPSFDLGITNANVFLNGSTVGNPGTEAAQILTGVVGVPEPSSIVLLGVALVGFVGLIRRKRS